MGCLDWERDVFVGAFRGGISGDFFAQYITSRRRPAGAPDLLFVLWNEITSWITVLKSCILEWDIGNTTPGIPLVKWMENFSVAISVQIHLLLFAFCFLHPLSF